MEFWERVKLDVRAAMKEGADLIKEGTAVLATETSRVTKKGAAAMSVEARKMMEEGVATAKKGAATVSTEARRMGRIARLRYQLFLQNQKAEAKFTEIGGLVYDLSAKGSNRVRSNGQVRKRILEAKQIEERIKKLKIEIVRVSKSSKP